MSRLLYHSIAYLLLFGLATTPASILANDFGNFEVLDQLSFDGAFSINKSIKEFITSTKGYPLTTLANILFQIGVVVVIAVGLIMIVIGGYIYMTAGGNASQIGTAKTFIGSALAGIILALTGWLILNTISTQFTKPAEPRIVTPTPRPPGSP